MKNYEKVPFNEQKIRVIKDEAGSVSLICLDDVCRVTRMSVLIHNGKAMAKCGSAVKVKGRVYADIPDTRKLILWIRKNTKLWAESCNELLGWIKALQSEHVVTPDVQDTEMIHLEYDDHEFTAKTTDGRLMFNATQMAKPFKKLPWVWINFKSTKEFRQQLVVEGKSPDFESQVVSSRGSQGATWLDALLVPQYAQWLSPEFASFCNDVLMQFMNTGNVKLTDVMPGRGYKPAIRNPLPAFPIPDNYDDAVQVIRNANELIAANEHKRQFYDDMVESREWFTTTAIALELNSNAIQLNQFLAEEGIQQRVNGVWKLNMQYRTLKAEHFYEWEHPNLHYIFRYRVMAWTPGGREFILDLWKSKFK